MYGGDYFWVFSALRSFLTLKGSPSGIVFVAVLFKGFCNVQRFHVHCDG